MVPGEGASATAPAAWSLLVCRAPHPRATEGVARYQGRIHGIRLQLVPFRVRATGRQVTRWEDVRPGCLVVRCVGCGGFTEYEILGSFQDDESDDAPGPPLRNRTAEPLVAQKRKLRNTHVAGSEIS